MASPLWFPIDCSLAAPTIVCLLAMFPTILWGLSPVVVKYALAEGGTPLQALVVILVVDTGLLWLATAIFQGPDAILSLSPTALGVFAAAGVLGTAVGRLVVYEGIDRLGAAIAIACLGVRPLFSTVLGVIALGEWIALPTVLGVLVLSAGLVVLSLSKGGDIHGWRRRDLLFPLAGAGLYAVASAIRRVGLQETATGPLAAVTVNETAALFAVLGYVLVRGRSEELVAPTRTYALFALSGGLVATGMVSVFFALGHPGGRVVIVDPLIAITPLFTTVFAYFLLQDIERITRGIAAGATVIVAGAVLVVLG